MFEMCDVILARCDAIIVTRFELSKIYLLGCSIDHVSLISLASIHSEIHREEGNFLHLPTPPPSPSQAQGHYKSLAKTSFTLRRRNLKTEVSLWNASNVFRPHYAGGI